MDATFAQGWMWAGFIAFVVLMLAVDLLALGGGRSRKVSLREAGLWSLAWFTLAMIFNALLWWYLDGNAGREIANTKAMEFFTGYLIEKSLSVDNLFVFLTIFSFFAIPPEYQRRVLIYGVLGAIVMRAVMILAGIWLVQQFSWLLYVFGALLIATGIKMLLFADQQPDISNNPVLKWMRGHLKMTDELYGERFVVWKNGVRYFTPLFAPSLNLTSSSSSKFEYCSFVTISCPPSWSAVVAKTVKTPSFTSQPCSGNRSDLMSFQASVDVPSNRTICVFSFALFLLVF